MQVSHHPPISAFYAEHAKKRMSVNAHIYTKSSFLGMSVSHLRAWKENGSPACSHISTFRNCHMDFSCNITDRRSQRWSRQTHSNGPQRGVHLHLSLCLRSQYPYRPLGRTRRKSIDHMPADQLSRKHRVQVQAILQLGRQQGSLGPDQLIFKPQT